MRNSVQFIILTFLIITLVFLMGCISDPDGKNFLSYNRTREPFQLNDVWPVTLSKSGIEDRTAELGNLMVQLDENASVDFLLMDFSGKEGTIWKTCQVDLSSDGQINVRCQEQKNRGPFSTRLHPDVVFSSIEELPIRSFDPLGNGITIWTGPTCCELGYRSDNIPTFKIENGSLMPIESIVFDLSSSETIYPIHMCKNQQAIETDTFSNRYVRENTTGLMNDHCWTVFVQEDVLKAEMVRYPN